MKRSLLAILVLLLFSIAASSQVVRSFVPRYYNASVRGTIKYVSNSIVRSATGTGEAPPVGSSVNTSQTGINIDIDPDATTFNSSTADLSLPACSQILFAGLYWGGGKGTPIPTPVDTVWRAAATSVKLKLPGSAVYLDLTSTQTDYANPVRFPSINFNMYQCFYDITSLVTALATPTGTYGVANVANPSLASSNGNCFGGWTIIIAYSNPSLLPQNLTVFDGCALIRPGAANALNVPISGFLTPPSGAVSCEYGAVVLDGDRNDPDSCLFRQGPPPPAPGAFYNLAQTATNPMSGNTDFMNSRITHLGANVATRNPNFTNTLGYDASIQTLPNAPPLSVLNAQLGNSQTQCTFRFSTIAESYTLSAVTTVISVYNPSFAFEKTSTDLSGGSLTPGDSLRYQMNYNNLGNDASTNTRIIDNIPTGTSYKPGTIRINGTLKTDAADSDEAEYDFANNRIVYRVGTGATGLVGGEVASGASGNVTFDVYMPSSCAVIACSGTMRNRARMTYGGKISLSALEDSSGVSIAGCLQPQDKTDIVIGSCSAMGDTILINRCPSLTVRLPVARYAGYSFHTGIPFTAINRFHPDSLVRFTRVMYAYYDAPGACIDDTARIAIFITGCPDIDDDNDGLPDYLEGNNPLAYADQDGDTRPNWADNTPGFPILWVDNNSDGFNDWFDPSADVDGDGILNFYDTSYPLYIDSNGDAVNDLMDKDRDGIPNHLDLDSDNDGIPDTVESFGVDANGDGRIDNYTDSDNDGFSDNADGNEDVPGGTWLRSSGLGLGALDTDGDLIPNYWDLDSDNDGIPDITEAFGIDVANSAKVSVFADLDGDGYADALDADVGNDNIAENSAASLLRTGADVGGVLGDGFTDSWPFKNMDADSKPNPYDLDSDGDGITDVREAQFTDNPLSPDGQVDGAIDINGRNTALAALGSLTIPNTDGVGRTNPYDIDSDEDGIPDNVEGLSTLGYQLPSGLDADGDGIDDTYDFIAGPGTYGGRGINPVNTDGDTFPTPDYLDTDTDNDGLIDRIEGNDLNLNGRQDDIVSLLGTDADGDGLDDRFDNNNTNAEATSARMGNGGTTTGDPTPGSITTVQRTPVAFGCATERDWRCLPYVLSCEFISFKAVLQSQRVQLDWAALCRQEIDYFIIERSTDRSNFTTAFKTQGSPVLNEVQLYNGADDISGISSDIIYYRLKSVMKSGRIILSNIIAVKRSTSSSLEMRILPNPISDQLQILISTVKNGTAAISIIDGTGRTVYHYKENLQKGSNTITYTSVNSLPEGMYYVRVQIAEVSIIQKFSKVK
jgi:uncharacterized repeat protein (TIGR01451 family)